MFIKELSPRLTNISVSVVATIVSLARAQFAATRTHYFQEFRDADKADEVPRIPHFK